MENEFSRWSMERHFGRLWGTPDDEPGATFSFCIPPVPKRLMDGRRPDKLRTTAVKVGEYIRRHA